MKLEKRADAEMSGETKENKSEETPKSRDRYGRSVIAYIAVLFSVVIMLILLSYFMQQRNSATINSITQQHKEFSAQALENIENLQNKNQELLLKEQQNEETIESLNARIAELEEDISAAAEELETEKEAAEGKYKGLEDKYRALGALIRVEQALLNEDEAAAKQYLLEMEPYKGALDEEWLKVYNDLAKKLS